MSVLLTDEEIEHLWATALGDNPHWQPDAWGLFGIMTRAQLKNIVEYLRPYIHIRTDAPYKSTIDPDAWQVLKEEVGL